MQKCLTGWRQWTLAFLFWLPFQAQASDLIITGIIDGPLSGGTPKALELYAVNAIADLSIYGVGSAPNGGASSGVDFTLSGSAAAGEFLYVASESTEFTNFFGFAPTFTNSVMNINGDDAIELFQNGAVVDVYGVVGADGSGQPWDHLDGWAYRNAGTTATTVFTPADWTFSGINALDGATSNATAATPFPSGTYTAGGGTAGAVTITESAGSTAVTEGGVTDTFEVVLNTQPTADVTITINAGTQVTTNATILAFTSVNWNVAQTVTVTAVDDATVEGTHSGTIQFSATSSDADYNGLSIADVTVTITDNDAAATVTKIHAIQGTTDVSPLVGQTVMIQGIVVADFQDDLGANRIRGFYVQEEVADQDADPLTSEGIFVYCDTCTTAVNVGDAVTITGDVSEFQNQTQLGGALTVAINSTANPLPTASIVTLPVTAVSDFERFEGMLVTFLQELFVTELYQLGRFGQVTLSSTARLDQPTNVVLPGVAANALQAANNLNRIILDDFTNGQNPDPIIFGRDGNALTAANTLRGGDSVTNLSGVLVYSWGGNSASPNAYRVRVQTSPNFVANNARPTQAPDTTGANLKIATFNVLNYFNTFGANCYSDTDPFATDCRGADSAEEFTRQSDKTVAAIQGLNADILALNELENDGFAADSAIQDLVNKINAVMGSGTYAFVNPSVNNVGGDAITVGFLYKPATVEIAPNTTVALLETGEFAQSQHRVPMAVTFRHKASGEIFTATAIHFKSKGSLTGEIQDADQGDGQGNNNYSRTIAAQELRAWLATNPTGTSDPDYMVLGDFNAYALEDPVREFTDNGFVNLIGGYSYVFNGQWGSLDHIVANTALAAQFVTGGKYHINADEPTALDYNVEFKSANQKNSLYAANPFRASDHDPVLAGFNLRTPQSLSVTAINDGTGKNTLRNIIAAANANDTIDLTQLRGTLNLTAPLEISKNLTLQGPDTLTFGISGRNQHALFVVKGGATLTLNDLYLYRGNAGSGNGGALQVIENSTIVLNRVRLQGNQATNGGAIFIEAGSSVQLINSLVAGNYATASGAGIANQGKLEVINSHIVFNRAGGQGGGIFNDGSLLTLRNSLIWNNTDGSGRSSSSNSAASVQQQQAITSRVNSLVQGLAAAGGNGDGLLNAVNYPQLIQMGNSQTATMPSLGGDFRPKASSVLIDNGDNASYDSSLYGIFDLFGKVRVNGTINIGAFE